MSHRTASRTWLVYAIIFTILGGTLASAVTINVDGGCEGNYIIAPGESWKFFKGTQPPSDPPNEWTTADFDDSQWQTGPAGFGYGDNDDVTVLDDMQGNYVSVYIRKGFTGASLSPDDIVTFEIDYDDGFIAYLNGVEIARANMPEDTAFDTTASSAHEAGSPETFVLGTVGELLNEGGNVLAVQGHNASSNSSDFSLNPAIRTGSNITGAGEITEDTTWSGACVVEQTIVIPAGVVLKIEPGTTILMKDAAGMVVYGQLLAEGTKAEPILFTRYGDGVAWKQIMFVEAADSRLAHCVIEYADSEGEHQDYYEPGPRNYHEAIVALACHLDIEDCIFRNLPDESGNAEGDAIAIISDDQDHPGNATANIRGCEFLSIGQGVHTRYSYVLVEECFFTGKRGDNDDVDLWGESTPAPLIQNNLFLNPEHDDMINPTRCSAVIVGNVIAGSDDHGIVLRDRGFPVLMNNLIMDCSSAGVAVENSCQATLINNTIVDCGRGLRLFDLGRWGPPYNLNPGGGTATVINCIIWDCPQPVTLTDSSNAEIEDRGSHITVRYSDIEGGQSSISVSGSHSTVTWGQGNIDVDPQFVAASSGDFHLKSQAGRWNSTGESWVMDNVTSPCIDAGDPDSPVAFEPYPNGGIINMGAYGGTPEASKSPSGIHAKYGGGTGEPDNPYLIYTDMHMNTIGIHEEDFDKHFKLMANIDLSGLGEKEFNIIGNFTSPFRGVFDGDGHTISNFRYISTDVDDVGLFQSVQGVQARITDLGLIEPVIDVESDEPLNIIDWNNPDVGAIYGNSAGALVNYLSRGAILSHCYVRGGSVSGDLWVGGLASNIEAGTIDHCYSTAEVSGKRDVGGLVGYNLLGIISSCRTTSNVTGKSSVGGLAGYNGDTIRDCSATGDVNGDFTVGGLTGNNTGTIQSSYSTGNVTGIQDIGALVGRSRGNLTNCYSTSNATGEKYVGGLVGILNGPTTISNCYSAGNVIGITEVGGIVGAGYVTANVLGSFWDIEASGQTTGFVGTGKTTAEMQTAATFLEAGWDFLGETENGTDDIWWILEGQDYPRLWWELSD